MIYNFSNNTPIFLQIEDIIKNQIISGKLKSGERINPVRELSIEFKVNPNTIQNALRNLEELGLIYTDSTNGKYVTNNTVLIQQIKENHVSSLTNALISNLENLGLNKQEILKKIKEKLND